jgi:hypothetical protein
MPLAMGRGGAARKFFRRLEPRPADSTTAWATALSQTPMPGVRTSSHPGWVTLVSKTARPEGRPPGYGKVRGGPT